MKDYFKRNKTFILIVLVTCVLLFGGIFLFTHTGTNVGSLTKKVDSSLLIPQDAITTSGIVNGTYLPATSSAAVSLVEFGDYECPACSTYNPLVKEVLTTFSGKVNFTFRNFPLSQHTKAIISSYAAEAAGLQGKFWQMHDKLYDNQNEWVSASDTTNIFTSYAKDIGLNVDKFLSDMDSSKVKEIVQNGLNDGETIGLTETPTFYLNGQKIILTGSTDILSAAVQSALNTK